MRTDCGNFSDTEEKRARYKDFPIGLQLVGQRQMEAKLLKISSLVDELVSRNCVLSIQVGD